jgi:hypothetical protein
VRRAPGRERGRLDPVAAGVELDATAALLVGEHVAERLAVDPRAELVEHQPDVSASCAGVFCSRRVAARRICRLRQLLQTRRLANRSTGFSSWQCRQRLTLVDVAGGGVAPLASVAS